MAAKIKVMKSNLGDLNDFLKVFEIVEALKKIESGKEGLEKGGITKIFDIRKDFYEKMINGDFVGNNSMKFLIFYSIVIVVFFAVILRKIKKQDFGLDFK